jgi:hypothetical protein
MIRIRPKLTVARGGKTGRPAMKTRQEFQLEIEDQLAEIEEGIDEMRRQQREARQRSRSKNGPSASPPWTGTRLLPDDE